MWEENTNKDKSRAIKNERRTKKPKGIRKQKIEKSKKEIITMADIEGDI